MLDTGSVNAAFKPGEAAGVQNSDWLSLDRARMPSFFLQTAEPFGGAMSAELHPPYHYRGTSRSPSPSER